MTSVSRLFVFSALLLLTILALLFLTYNFVIATWSAPSAMPPNGNTEPPINVGTSTQSKSGDLIVNILAAASEVWSDNYCDISGNNCNPTIGAPVSPLQTGTASGTFNGSYTGSSTLPAYGSQMIFVVDFPRSYVAKPVVSLSQTSHLIGLGCYLDPVITIKPDLSDFTAVYTLSAAPACSMPTTVRWVAMGNIGS